jgi:phosphonate transport system permease protein
VVALLILASFVFVRLNPFEIIAAIPQILEILGRFVPPDFATNPSGLWEGLVETVAIGIVATVFGVLISIPLGFAMARNVTPARWLYNLSRYLIVVYRSVPELIIAVLFVAAVGLGPFAGTLALAFGTAGFAAKLFADSLEEINPAPREAVSATGATELQERAAAVVPQALPMLIGTSLYVLDINIRAATILGIVGAGGIGFILIQSIRTLDFDRVTAVMIVIFVVVYAIERFSGYLRSKLI